MTMTETITGLRDDEELSWSSKNIFKLLFYHDQKILEEKFRDFKTSRFKCMDKFTLFASQMQCN